MSSCYSIFRGRIGAVDAQLAAEERLVMIETTHEIDTRIPVQQSEIRPAQVASDRHTLLQVVQTITDIVESYSHPPGSPFHSWT
ncbi:MAG: hypothetical protein KA191_01275 [Verrucomicrobia bacterium]|jgi:hypothetical protein|nr:hypothetical protein [Verrucomicrobiota bacterium]OQC66505.1 MAG: hypothetical protein BWX48_01466 [Verrucomicrobia bacterium ADurb.Bin006]HPW15159.1 hypothetical protein [Nitrospira sp.]MDI9381966.1 hypothetical protein [Verrucomicrobiota bacterium]NMD20626.1 hypothetical protein [Verrucomicrobiota bacterium]